MPLKSFHPGALWLDNHGIHINAHGGGILHHDGIYYWFGEHKIEGVAGNAAHVGVHAYSSRDLYIFCSRPTALAGQPTRRGCSRPTPCSEIGRNWETPAWVRAHKSRTPSIHNLRLSCRCRGSRMPTFSWRIAGSRKTRLTAVMSGCLLNSVMACQRFRGTTNGTYAFLINK